MIEIKEKKDCCGCGACMNACPVGCIRMEADEEGFLYPSIDAEACVGCGLCERVCPVLHAGEDIPFEQSAYLLQHRNAGVRSRSTTGGAFTAIARYVTDRGGLVYGAVYDENLRVRHTGAEGLKELDPFRGSKYVQSDTERTFTEVKEHLEKGRLVCYSGTPCQIEGLLGFLQKPYDNLVTVDIVCHAVPSPLIWQRYLEMQRRKLGSEIGDAKFRDKKHYGYQYSTMTLLDGKGQELYAQGIDTDQMLRAFFSDICDRPSCYSCSFKKRYRKSDFTIWDCYPVYDFDKRLDDKGTNRVLIHSEKGRRIFEEIRENCRVVQVEPDALTAGVREMFHSVNGNPRREEFFKDAGSMDGQSLFDRYFPITMKNRLERAARLICFRTGIYTTAKRAARRILKK